MGHLHQISVSNGGVPKLAVASATIDSSGVAGDSQADTVHHGSPDQALCLYSLEVIQALQREGHPIAPGSAGENLTLAGVDWETLEPGDRIHIGEVVEIEITYHTTPCEKNAQWFIGGHFSRMSHRRFPGSARMYARVIEGGEVRAGDVVRVTSGGPNVI